MKLSNLLNINIGQGLIDGIIATLLIALLGYICKCLLVSPYNRYKKIYLDIFKFMENYKDTRNIEEHNPMRLKILFNQLDDLLEILNLIKKEEQISKFTYKFFNYEVICSKLAFLFDYIRNPIMLDENKEFNDEFRLNSKLYFEQLKKDISFAKFKVKIIAIILVVLSILICLII